ncbi:MAG: CapA family protein [Nocardioides sp.]
MLGTVVTAAFLWQLWSHVGVGPPPLPATEQAAGPPLVPTGWIVDGTTGQPVLGAVATLLGDRGKAASRADGSFALDLNTPRLVRVSAPGYATRVLAVGPEEPARVSLTPRGPSGLSLRFAGDAMLGRRFYEGTTESTPWLRAGADVAAHYRPLARIAPLLGDADLTVVNLETSLISHPHFAGSRPARFHPTKDLVFASAPETAVALRKAGVDVVDLGNNHVYDALSTGLADTIANVEKVGLAHFGAGRTLDEAWAPAYVRARGQVVAFLGCTTVLGDQHPIEYVVTVTQGGAAPCTESRLRATVAEARSRADVVVVMMHGGTEYVEQQDAEVRALTPAAADAGASLVVNGHPHVVGGVTQAGDTVVAESMGNLLFDQNLWSTLRSYLLRVDLEGGRVVHTSIDPFAIVNYAPVPTTGELADSSARAAAGLLSGPLLLTPGGADSQPGGPAGIAEITGTRDQVVDIPSGTWVPPQTGVTPGRDLLFGTGTFEKMDVGPAAPQPLLWSLGKYTRARREAACSGELGLRVIRQEGAFFDVVATRCTGCP